jgi:hypothetical protein
MVKLLAHYMIGDLNHVLIYLGRNILALPKQLTYERYIWRENHYLLSALGK